MEAKVTFFKSMEISFISHVLFNILGIDMSCFQKNDANTCYVGDGELVVWTTNKKLFAHLAPEEYHIRTRVDKTDTNSAYFYFTFPEKFRKELNELNALLKYNPPKKWNKFIEKMKAEYYKTK